jgi:D-glycero-alpha-D-manno-heptose-7-phosphate kinase
VWLHTRGGRRVTHRPVFLLGMPIIVATAPTRIDFAGGWTDVPPYPEEEGGRVCNVAISRYAEVQLHPTETRGSADPVEFLADSGLAAAALKRSGVRGARPAIRSDYPTGAGLGGSSAVGVALAAAIRAWQGRPTDDRTAIAEESRAVEVEEVGIAGGRQDHYAAAYGGALDLSFGAETRVTPIPLSADVRSTLARRCLVAYTGQSRISGETITAVLDAYKARAPHVVQALARMRALAGVVAQGLASGDWDSVGEAVGEHWVHQRALHPAITTDRIEAVLAAAHRAGAIGGKALGASGGGCVAREGAEDAVRAAVAPLALPLTFDVDTTGVRVQRSEVADG